MKTLYLLIALLFNFSGTITTQLNTLFLSIISIGLVIEILGLWSHRSSLKNAKSEGAASFYEQTTTYGNSYWLRNALLLITLTLSMGMLLTEMYSLWAYATLAILSLSAAIISRALFYVVVIPTTMPGAFFWRNTGFVEHARETGLADMPQLGVVYERHHKFKLAELIETIRTTTLNDKISQFKRVFTG